MSIEPKWRWSKNWLQHTQQQATGAPQAIDLKRSEVVPLSVEDIGALERSAADLRNERFADPEEVAGVFEYFYPFMTVRYTEVALGELYDAVGIIARDSHPAAARVAAAIEETVQSILRDPEGAPVVGGPDVRAARVGDEPFRIYYAARGDGLVIRNIRRIRPGSIED